MTITRALLTFLIASGLLTVTPGLDTALVLRTAATGGERRASAAGLGICVGLLTWGLSVSVGMGALLEASHASYGVLRVAGAAYLVYLGGRMFFRRGVNFAPDAKAMAAGEAAQGDDPRRWFLRGMLTNLLNPKVGVFYVTFLPLFIPGGVNVVAFSVLLAAIHAIEGIVWFAVLILAVRPLSLWLRRPRVGKTLDRITGTVFVGCGLRLLFERR